MSDLRAHSKFGGIRRRSYDDFGESTDGEAVWTEKSAPASRAFDERVECRQGAETGVELSPRSFKLGWT